MRFELSGLQSILEAKGMLDALSDGQAKAVMVNALNHTANQIRLAIRADMPTVFDRPTPFTLNSLRVLNATTTSLDAAVWVQDEKDGASKGFAPEDWVAPQVFSGTRDSKKSERLLRARGVLPSDRFIMPGVGAQLDAYGNLSRGQMNKILSGLGIESTSGATSRASRSKRSLKKGNAKAYFVLRRGRVPIGIAERRGSSLRIVLAFVKAPTYTARLPFHETAQRVTDANLDTNVDIAFTKARVAER